MSLYAPPFMRLPEFGDVPLCAFMRSAATLRLDWKEARDIDRELIKRLRNAIWHVGHGLTITSVLEKL
jgi:hypothetical protein